METDPAFRRFLRGVQRIVTDGDARAVLVEELCRRGVNEQLAQRRGNQLAVEFHEYERAVADYTFQVQTPHEEELVREAIALCKRAWLEQRIQAEFRSLGV